MISSKDAKAKLNPVKSSYGPAVVAARAELPCGNPSIVVGHDLRTVEKDFSQLDPAEMAQIKRRSLGYRSALKIVKARLEAVEGATPFHDHLLDRNEIVNALHELQNSVNDVLSRAHALPK